MNYHQGLKTELEARMPELTACQELGRSLPGLPRWVGGRGFPFVLCAYWGGGPALMPLPTTCHSQIQAQLDKLGTRKEEVSDKWDRHWEWLQQSECGPRHTGLKGTGHHAPACQEMPRG